MSEVQRAMSNARRYAFPAPKELHERMQAAIDALRTDFGDRAKNTEFQAAVTKLTDFGLEYYFVRPLDLASVTGFHAKTARVGVASMRRAVGGFIKRLLKPLSPEQLETLCRFIEGLTVR